jgi:hypothetical protein
MRITGPVFSHRFRLCLWLVVLLSGCAGRSVHEPVSQLRYADQISARFHAEGFNTRPSLVQQIGFTDGKSTLEFTAMVEISDDALTIAGLSPLGKREFVMTATEKDFSYSGEPLFELPFPPQYLLRDFLLVYGRSAVLNSQSGQQEVLDNDNRREIRHAGQSQIQIEYQQRGFATGKTTFTHLVAGYILQIDTVQVDFPAEVITSDSEEE